MRGNSESYRVQGYRGEFKELEGFRWVMREMLVKRWVKGKEIGGWLEMVRERSDSQRVKKEAQINKMVRNGREEVGEEEGVIVFARDVKERDVMRKTYKG